MKLIFLFLTPFLLTGARITVCASGCDQTTFIAGYNAASPGDIVELKAGETFPSSAHLAWKSWDPTPIIIRSSQWFALPPQGYRVNDTDHGALMPILEADSSSDPIVRLNYSAEYLTIDSVDTGANTITLSSTTGIVEGDPIACRPNLNDGSTMPGGLTENVVYYLKNVSSAVVSLALNQGGSVIDITSAGTGTTKRCVPVKVAHHIIFQGIWFKTKSNIVSDNYLIVVGSAQEAAYAGMSRGVVFDRILLSGIGNDTGLTQNGPRGGILGNSLGLIISDSSITNVKYASTQTLAFWTGMAGSSQIINSSLNSAGINILTGGSGSAIRNSLPSLDISRSYLYKLGHMVYNQGSGAPTGAAFPGRFYRDTAVGGSDCSTSGKCYVADGSSAWQISTTATYRADDYLTINLIETKDCINCKFSALVLKNGFAAQDTGNPGWCFLASKVNTDISWTRTENTVFKNSLCDNTWRGIAIGTAGNTTFKNNNITINNILMTNMSDFPSMSIWPDVGEVQDYPFRMDASTDGSLIDHVTARKKTGTTANHSWFLTVGLGVGAPWVGSKFTNNIGQQQTYGLLLSGSDGTCGAAGMGAYMQTSSAPYPIQNVLQDGADTPAFYSLCTTNMTNVNPVPYVGASNSRLTPGSPYSADCVSGCLYTGTDGKDLGADIDLIESETSNVVDGKPGWFSSLVITPGSTRVVFKYNSPDSLVNNLIIYTDAARLIEHGDTNSAGEKADDRTGNITNAASRQFVLGTNVALTANTTYYYKLANNAGTKWKVGEFKTFPAASAAQPWGFQFATATASRYSVNADMSSSTTISSRTNPIVSVAQGAIVYFQTTGVVNNGPIQVMVAR